MKKKAAVKNDKRNRKKRMKLHEVSIQNDMKYRGPISYQGFQGLGWFCIVLTVLMSVLKLGSKLDEGLAKDTASLIYVLEYVTSLSLPFMLIANFSKILSNKEGYLKQLLRNGATAVGIAAATILLFMRYVLGAAQQVVSQPDMVLPLMTETFAKYNPNGYIAFNLFIDLFLCTLTMYFLNARPKRVFTGKKVLILRFATILPIAYEAASLWLKMESCLGGLVLPFWCFPMLTVKPPMTFVLFVFLAIHLKVREHRFCRHGRSHEEYLTFLNTNRNSLHFSLFMSVSIVITAVLDFILMFVLMGIQSGSLEAMQNQEILTRAAEVAISIGIGGSFSMVLVIPFLLLYSYNRTPKRKVLSMLFPPVAIALIILILLEGVYQALGALTAGQKIDLEEMMNMLAMMAAM